MKQKNPLYFLSTTSTLENCCEFRPPISKNKTQGLACNCRAKDLARFRFLYKSVFDQVEIGQTFSWLYLYRFLYKIACTNFEGKKAISLRKSPANCIRVKFITNRNLVRKEQWCTFDRPLALSKTQTSTLFFFKNLCVIASH